ncbi:MAG: HD domain-containing protein [Methanosphaera sp.]|nr:HD domain-containing protein [Methanosphaera sp.]
MPKKEKDYIKKFDKTRRIISQFLVKEKTVKRTKNNKPYLELVLQDKTGQIKGRMFNKKANNEFDKIEENTVYNIVGKIQEFPVNSNKYNILIDRIILAKKYNEEEFIRKIENQDSHLNYILETINEIKDHEIKSVLTSLFNDKEFLEKFITAPAAKRYHHNYKGGLLVHTNEVIEICKTISSIYEEINRDLLIAGAILHDIGKIESYDYKTDEIDMNYEGMMLEHLFIGGCLLKEKMNYLNISKETKTQLLHLILSHHGKVELGWGSSVDPKTPEAIALHQADDMSAKITQALEF